MDSDAAQCSCRSAPHRASKHTLASSCSLVSLRRWLACCVSVRDQMSAELGALSKENQQLKSQLFDSFQTEKALKAQMEGLGMSTLGVGDSAKVARLEGELAVLQSALATKDNEHKELMAICTDLISQVETLKAQQNQ